MPRSTKKVTFWDEAQTHGERVPLITVSGDAGPGSSASAAADAEGNQNTSFFHYYSSGFGGEDAVAALEKLPALLVLTCSVFTVSGCCSVVLGAVSSFVRTIQQDRYPSTAAASRRRRSYFYDAGWPLLPRI